MSHPIKTAQKPGEPTGEADLLSALTLLRTHQEVLDDLLEGRCLLWLGSGISRERFPSLQELLAKLVEELRTRAQDGDAGCLTALKDISVRANWPIDTPDELGNSIDLAAPSEQWPGFNGGILTPTGQYDKILDIPVEGWDDPDPIIHSILKLPEIYAAEEVEPDAEHRLVALLVKEGVLEEVVTTNWDDLIERASERCRCSKELSVIAHSDEIPNAPRPVLFKIHGCARKILANPDRYKTYLVATQAHISSWAQGGNQWQAYQDRLRSRSQDLRSVVVGFSFQDQNLRNELVRCRNQLPELWKKRELVFAKPQEDAAQAEFDKQMNGARLSFIPLWAKPFLGALYWQTLRSKAEALFALARDVERDQLGHQFSDCLDHAEAFMCNWQRNGAASDSERWQRFAAIVPWMIGRSVTLFRKGQVPSPAEPFYQDLYQPLVMPNAKEISKMNELSANSYHRLWLIAGVLAELSAGPDPALRVLPPLPNGASAGHCRIKTPNSERTLFVLEDEALEELVARGCLHLIAATLPGEQSEAEAPQSHTPSQSDPPSVTLIFPRGPRRQLLASQRGRPERQLPSPTKPREPLSIWLDEELRETQFIRNFSVSLRDFFGTPGEL